MTSLIGTVAKDIAATFVGWYLNLDELFFAFFFAGGHDNVGYTKVGTRAIVLCSSLGGRFDEIGLDSC